MSTSPQRVLVLGGTTPRGRRLSHALRAAGWQVRIGRPWYAPPVDPGFEEAIVDEQDHGAMLDAMRGCNAIAGIIFNFDEPPTLSTLEQQVRRVRLVLETIRQCEVERFVILSSASTVTRPPGEMLASERGAYLPGSRDDLATEARYAIELECFRYAADALYVTILNPSFILSDAGVRRIPAHLPDDAPVNVIHEREVHRMVDAAIAHGRPGVRYLLGGPNTTIGALRHALARRNLLAAGDPPARDLALLTHGEHLDTSRARAELGLHVPADLDGVWG